ncbi:MAG: recombinase family protein [candidate division WOR-3 bacterium]
MEKWSRAYGHRLTFFKDLDVSGLKSDRPQFTLMMERLRNNGFEGCVVTKLDRLGRSTVDLLVLQRAGRPVVAADRIARAMCPCLSAR